MSIYLNSTQESGVSFANLSSDDVHLQFGGQTLFDVDGPFGIWSVSVKSGNLQVTLPSIIFPFIDCLFLFYLSIQERNFEGFLQHNQLGLLQELDGREKSVGAIVHTQGYIWKLLNNTYCYIR